VSWQNLIIPFISCAPFFAGSPYSVNECPRSLPFRLTSASQISIDCVSTLAFPFSHFMSSLGRFAFWRSASLVWKRTSFNTPARAKQSVSGSAVRFNYLAASQVVDAGWFTYFASNLYNSNGWKFLWKEMCVSSYKSQKAITFNQQSLKLTKILKLVVLVYMNPFSPILHTDSQNILSQNLVIEIRNISNWWFQIALDILNSNL